MLYKAVIFDLDGTLLDTLQDIADSVNRVLRAKGFPTHTLDAFRFFVGDGSRTLIERALPENERSDDSIEHHLRAFKNDYANAWDVKTQPYAGISELLSTLVHNRIRMAVCSNKPHEFTVLCVQKMLHLWRFDTIIGHSSQYPKKPAPDSALAIAHDMGISPSEVLFLGDSGVDMRTAVAAGMLPVGAAWGFRSEEELMENGCRFLACSPMDILKIMEQSSKIYGANIQGKDLSSPNRERLKSRKEP